MIDDRQRPNVGSFTHAMSSAPMMYTCAKPSCQSKHDGNGSKKWIAGTQLMLCRHCVDERETAKKQRQAA